jgi:hypothetical protein
MMKCSSNDMQGAPASPGRYRVKVDGVSEAEWSSWLSEFDDASIYQTWAYGAVSWGEAQLSHLALMGSDGPVALAQLRLVKLPVLGAGVAYLRWGPCVQRRGMNCAPAVFGEMLGALVEEYARRRGLLLRILPNVMEGDQQTEGTLAAMRGLGLDIDAAVPPYRTIRVDLSSDPAVIRKRFDGKWRNQLNGAERNGLKVIEGTGTELYETFCQIYHEMMDRKRFDTTVDVAEFGRIQRRLPESQKMLTFVSLKDDVPQTALVASRVGATGIYLLGATSNDGMKSKGSYLLQWRMMNRLKELGCRWYDLGGINPEANPGVYHFKQGMGGEECTQLNRQSISGSWLSRVAVPLGERLRAAVGRKRR